MKINRNYIRGNHNFNHDFNIGWLQIFNHNDGGRRNAYRQTAPHKLRRFLWIYDLILPDSRDSCRDAISEPIFDIYIYMVGEKKLVWHLIGRIEISLLTLFLSLHLLRFFVRPTLCSSQPFLCVRHRRRYVLNMIATVLLRLINFRLHTKSKNKKNKIYTY